jgi:thiol-disulfide isomerase/thioredoxin/outer membrane lipoprotein-sorting protein
MKSLSLGLTLFVISVLTAPFGIAQNPARDALQLLDSVGDHYAEAQSYRLEAIEETTISNEFRRHWDKTLLTAVAARDGRYRYEVQTEEGAAARVSDGKTKWEYRAVDHLYTQSSISADDKNTRWYTTAAQAIEEAQRLVLEIRLMGPHLKSAELLSDEAIELNGRKIKCFVVRFGSADFKGDNSDVKIQETVWIAQSTNLIVKTYKRSETHIITPSEARIPIVEEKTVVYPVTELNEPEADTKFVFTPPPDAKLVESFLEPYIRKAADSAPSLVGKLAPDVSLKAGNGELVSLAAYRGKPVFIEFWSTWCAPCLDLVPDLKRLYEETESKGLVWIGIDNDEDPSTAQKFLSQEHIPWSNYHDGDGSLGKAFNRRGVPLAVLIDASGKISFYKAGYRISALRTAIENLKLTSVADAVPQTTSK